MRFDLEDKKKISLLSDLLRALTFGKSNVLFVWHRTEGWAVLQNQEYLDNLDSSNMVNLCHVKSHFFSHISPDNREFLCFELDVTNLARVLKSISKQIKRMVWHAYNIDETSNKAQLQINFMVDEGHLEVQRDIFLITRINPQFYFKLFRDFIEEKTQYLEIKQVYMKQMKDLQKNECVYFKFHDEYVSAYNIEAENKISIKKNALEKYDYPSLIRNLGGKNRLTIPPNFLVPQLMMGMKLRDPIQLFISNDIVDDHISVSLRTKNESFSFISQFKSIMEHDEDEYNLNPFLMNNIKLQQPYLNQNSNIINSNNNNMLNAPIMNGAAAVIQEEDNNYGSISSHINGLTNQMHLAHNYQSSVLTPLMESEFLKIKGINRDVQPQMRDIQRKDIYVGIDQRINKPIQSDEQSPFKRPALPGGGNPKKRVNINEDQHNYGNDSLNTSNHIYSVTSSQQSNGNMYEVHNSSLLNKRKSDTSTDFSNLPFFRENANKRIKESNFSEIHCFQPESQSFSNNQNGNAYQKPGFVNPLVSQDKAENSFSNFINQNMKDADFSIFKSNTNVAGLQFQPQRNERNPPKQVPQSLIPTNYKNTKARNNTNNILF